MSIGIYFLSIIVIANSPIKQYIPNIKLTRGGYGHNLIRLREADTVKNIDYLFIGSSHVYRGFDVTVFKANDINVFNLGSSAQAPRNSYFLLKQYLPKIKPKKVIMDVYWGGFLNEGVESTIDILSNKKLVEEDLQMALSHKNIVPMNTYFASLFGNLTNDVTTANQLQVENDIYYKGGYVNRDSKIKAEVLKNTPQFDENESYNDVQWQYLIKCYELCRLHDIELILTRVPVTKELISNTKYYNEYTTTINNFCQTNKLVFLDFCTLKQIELIGLSSAEHYYDLSHLNKFGAEKFCNFLITNGYIK